MGCFLRQKSFLVGFCNSALGGALLYFQPELSFLIKMEDLKKIKGFSDNLSITFSIKLVSELFCENSGTSTLYCVSLSNQAFVDIVI